MRLISQYLRIRVPSITCVRIGWLQISQGYVLSLAEETWMKR